MGFGGVGVFGSGLVEGGILYVWGFVICCLLWVYERVDLYVCDGWVWLCGCVGFWIVGCGDFWRL